MNWNEIICSTIALYKHFYNLTFFEQMSSTLFTALPLEEWTKQTQVSSALLKSKQYSQNAKFILSVDKKIKSITILCMNKNIIILKNFSFFSGVSPVRLHLPPPSRFVPRTAPSILWTMTRYA